jgi:bacteriocin biosynthesis cyclodehydratase domain-containing protein
MALRLDPRIPLIWRNPRELQFGLDTVSARLTDPSVADERVIAALAGGAARPVLDAIATSSRATPEDVDRLLDKLGEVVVDSRSDAGGNGSDADGTVCARVALDGDGPAARALQTVLLDLGLDADLGMDAGLGMEAPTRVESARTKRSDRSGPIPSHFAADARIDAAVILAHYVIEPARYGRWLRGDIPHLPIVFSDQSVRVGPLVEPGRTACLFCLDLARTDEDSAWPAMATQLMTISAPAEAPLAVAEAVAVAARIVWGRLGPTPARAAFHATSTSFRLDSATGGITRRRHRPHPECACGGLPEIATGPGPVSGRHPRTSSAAPSVSRE